MKKIIFLISVLFSVFCVTAQVQTLHNPKDADGFYIVKWDCANGTFASANDFEVDETFTFAVDITGTPWVNWLAQAPTNAGATRSLAFNKWTGFGDLNGDSHRLKPIPGKPNIYAATLNLAQLATTMNLTQAKTIGARTYVFGQLFGFEYTSDNPGKGWWMWVPSIPEGTNVNPGTESGAVFATKSYTGTKTSPEIYNNSYGNELFGEAYPIKGYAPACAVRSGSSQDGSSQDGSSQDGSSQDGSSQDGSSQDVSSDRGYYDAPYFRYEAENAILKNGALKKGPDMDQAKIEAQASNMTYVELPSRGSALEWTIGNGTGSDGITLRFTMPDKTDGWQPANKYATQPKYKREDVFVGSLNIYVNGVKRNINQYGKISDHIPLSSYWMWQYFTGDQPKDSPADPHEFSRFAFDEVHFILVGEPLKTGDVLKIENADGNYIYGVDFVEIEKVPAPIPQPANSLSVASYGTGRNAIDACFAECKRQGKNMYFPAGVFEYYDVNEQYNIWMLNGANNIKITGAGMWYTNLHFPASKPSGGGIGGNRTGTNVEFCNMYLSSMLNSRFDQKAIYKGLMECWGSNAYIHDLWIEHFECGMWIGDYQSPIKITTGARISNCRIRNNLADGINLCQGTSNTTVEHCSFRGNGDDAIAMWNNNYSNAPDENNNIFQYNTIENNWRAAGIAIFGGNGHQILNNYVKDCYKGAGIRLNTDFNGYKFTNTQNIYFKNNTIVNCGTSWDCYGSKASNQASERGAVDLQGAVRNITFENTEICYSHRCAIQMVDQDKPNIKFINTKVNTVGLDGGTRSKFTWEEDIGKGRVVYLNGPMRPTFDGMIVRNISPNDLTNLQEQRNHNIIWVKPPVYENFVGNDCICEQQNIINITGTEKVLDLTNGRKIHVIGNTVKFSGLSPNDVVSVYTVLGVKLIRQRSSNETLNIDNLPKGIYIVAVDNTSMVEKIIIQ